MNCETKFLIVGIIGLLLTLALGFFLGHFWTRTIWVLEKAIAVEIVPLVPSKFAAGITAIHFFL